MLTPKLAIQSEEVDMDTPFALIDIGNISAGYSHAIGPYEYAKLVIKKQMRTAIAPALIGADGSVPRTMAPTSIKEMHMPAEPHIRSARRPHFSMRKTDKIVAITFTRPVIAVVVSGLIPMELKIVEE